MPILQLFTVVRLDWRHRSPALARLALAAAGGEPLDLPRWRVRHWSLTTLLALHVPFIFLLGLAHGFELNHVWQEAALAALAPVVALVAVRDRGFASLATSSGLLLDSALVLHNSGNHPASYVHLLGMLVLIGLYHEWVASVLAIPTVVALHVGSLWLDARAAAAHTHAIEAAPGPPSTWPILAAAALGATSWVAFFWLSNPRRGVGSHRSAAAQSPE